ncbi:helix-turn-helix transcriptional regulator [Nocardia sp. NPDC059246]|uniref:helix-turn-helix transcriptional regulator n=1 Tax=unclassified Nocardia TaxID=2637762 RepID=UPI0036862BD0
MSTTETYLTRAQVAHRLKLAPKTLANWASIGKGPRCIRVVGGRVRYPAEDYFAWERALIDP